MCARAPVCTFVYEKEKVCFSSVLQSSTCLVSQHLSAYVYRRMDYLSDLPQALQRSSHSVKPGSLSDPHRLRAEKPGVGIDFHLPAQQIDPGGGGEGGWA